MSHINVIKNDGSIEPLMISKATKSLEWSIEGINNVSLSEIEIQSKLHFYDGIKTSYILDVFIKTCDDLADLRNFNYSIVARNLKIQKMYKRVFNSIQPTSLMVFLYNRVLAGEYSNKLNPEILKRNGIDFDALENAIDHSRDFTFSSAGLDALIRDYGVCQYETPQFIYMAIAIDTFRDYYKNPTEYIINYYHALSTFKITLPTPEMKALRTDSTDYASCIIFRTGDTLDSWKASSNALIDHTAASAGCGNDIADIASLGDKVKNGKITHSGKLPILKSIDADIAKASQNGRRGSATPYINFFDPEIETIFALKSPRMPVEDRINALSYGIKVNQLVYDRAVQGKPLSLFSVRKAPKMLELFYGKDIDAFIEYYEECERLELYNSQIDARDFWERLVATESAETSAYYILNIDEINDNSHITRLITMANICIEYMTAIEPLSSYHPNRPDIGVCVLGNINQGIVTVEQLPLITDLIVRAQSHIMTRQKHPTSQANVYVDMYHDIGIGISNHAYLLANQGYRYGSLEAMSMHNYWMEHFSYYCHVSSVDIAKDLGPARGFIYHDKVLPINRYNKHVDELCDNTLYCDWEALDNDIRQFGMYNVGLMMVPPSESSSIPSNQTSSLEPIRNLVTIKDKAGVNFKQFAPDCLRLADKYDYAYDRPITKDFIKHVAITQKWIDKGISANTFYNPELSEGKVNSSEIIEDLFFAKYYGCKGRYYMNVKMPDEQEMQPQCVGGCSV